MTDPIDFENLKPEDTGPLAASEPEITPDPKASKDKPKWRVPAGDKADAPKRTSTPKKRAPTAKHGAFTEPLTEMYGAIGTILYHFDPVCATAILKSAPKAAQSLDDLAYTNPAVRRVLASLTTTSAIGAVIAAHAPILMAVYMHHSPGAQAMATAMGEQFADDVEKEMNSDDKS
jgi:hypothetical protein